MIINFPPDFIFGTSTASYQIETGVEHDWVGIKARDGHIFNRTTDHELRFIEDAALIASLAPHYRMSLMWSKLQRAPLAPFDRTASQDYHQLLQELKRKGVSIMMVIHHFANPIWFSKLGGWEKESNVSLWVDYGKRLVDEFGHYVSYWNTFNEPNLYASMGWALGQFPPFKSNLITAVKVVKNMAKAHDILYGYIKEKFPQHLVGISSNATVFTHENIWGWIPSKIADLWFMEYIPNHFSNTDFLGISYYAKISHDPYPITFLQTPNKLKKLGRDHDDMWEYYPQGLAESIYRYWNLFKKPIIITENGICTNNEALRVRAIRDYSTILHNALRKGVDLKGYYYWSPWDNFEWNLGPTYRFGLYECNLDTKERIKRPSADIYSKLAYQKEIFIEKGCFSAHELAS